MRVFVTGGSGFVGGVLIRKLLEEQLTVRALVRDGSNLRQLNGLDVEYVHGDLADLERLKAGMAGCDWVFHVAALYSYWGFPWETYYQSNVIGTRNVLKIAGDLGVERIVYTSSIAALGIPVNEQPANEETPVCLEDKIGHYKRSKFMAEQVASQFASEGLPVVIVNPAAPVGIGDHKPTATGQVIVDFLNGRMFGYVDTGLCIVDVEDVADGHILAAKHGRVGEKYILGGDNLSLKQVLDMLSDITGRPRVKLHIPHSVALGWSYLDTALAGIIPAHIPSATPDKVRLSRLKEYYDSSKAIRELGFNQTPASLALNKAVQWYRENGYIH
jgi:dihydroflavonol-4-reductase